MMTIVPASSSHLAEQFTTNMQSLADPTG